MTRRRGARCCWLEIPAYDLAGLIDEFPFLPADASVVGLILHSNSYPLTRSGPLPDAREQAAQIRHTDQCWPDSPLPGPECLCSRCGRPIVEELPIRIPWSDGSYEYRFHGDCYGLENPPALGAA